MTFKNLKIWLTNLKNSNTTKKEESYENIEEDDETPIEQNKEDKNPGAVKLNGGAHDGVMGLNRKMVVAIGAVLFTIVAASYVYNLQDAASKKEAKNNMVNTADKAATSGKINNEPSYEQVIKNGQGLANANNKFVDKNNPANSNGEDPLLKPKNGTQANNASTAATPATVPQIPARTATTPTVTTPQQPQTPTISEAERAEIERKRNEEERYRSAISFSIGGSNLTQSGQGSSTNADASKDGAKGTNGVQTVNTSFPSTAMPYMEASENVLQAGTLIPAMLFSGINTNVEGQIIAQTMADVYDTATHSNLLIPMGSQLIGTYAATASDGNNRVKVTFSTIVLPDGSAYAVDNSLVAVDGAGYNGIAGKIDHHTDKALRDGLINSAFTALSSSLSNRVYLDMSSIANITKMEGVRPTITINPGKEFNLFVTKPIIFAQ